MKNEITYFLLIIHQILDCNKIILASDEHGEHEEKIIHSTFNTTTTSKFSTIENKNEIYDTEKQFRI